MKWTDEELAYVRKAYPNTTTHVMAAKLGRSVSAVFQKADKLGLKKSPEHIASENAGRIQRGKQCEAMKAAQFKPGLVPWNKGKPGTTGVHEACRRTQFRDGNRPQTWVPIGSEVVTKDGILERKVSDTRMRNVDWRPVHVLVWEEANGPVPAGHVVIFRPGTKTAVAADIALDKLECLSRADLMRRNSYHRYGPEIAKAIQLRGAVNRQINKRAKHEQQQDSQ